MAEMRCLTGTSISATAQLRGKPFACNFFGLYYGISGQSEIVVWQFDCGTTNGYVIASGSSRVYVESFVSRRNAKGRERSSAIARYEMCLLYWTNDGEVDRHEVVTVSRVMHV